MPACATQKTIADQPTNGNLFLPVPDTDFRDFLEEVAQLLRFAPEIITAIEGDLDAHAREKKKLRLADRKMLRHGKKALAALTTPRGTRTGGVDAADTTMTTAITRPVCQGRANNRPIEALCPRKCRNSSLSRPKPRLNTEHRTLNTPIRKAFRMGSI